MNKRNKQKEDSAKIITWTIYSALTLFVILAIKELFTNLILKL